MTLRYSPSLVAQGVMISTKIMNYKDKVDKILSKKYR